MIDKSTSPATIDEYIAGFPPEIQLLLVQMRETIKEVLPDAVEKISYQMPTFYQKKNIVHFAAFKNHIGFYPTPSGITHFEEELSKYKSSKGTAQFPISEPLPLNLVREITLFRKKEVLGSE
ncbi:MAG: iron chaperone [Lachnospiraceae bacterium]